MLATLLFLCYNVSTGGDKMKVSELTLEFVKDYMRVDFDEDDQLIQMLLTMSKRYCANMIGCEIEDLDQFEDVTGCVLAVTAESYDVRQFTGETSQFDTLLRLVLNSHCKNFIGGQ